MSGSRPPVAYEWDAELVQSQDTAERLAGEVIDHYHTESYAEALRVLPDEGQHIEVVLVRDTWHDRAWAYVVDGKLPQVFTDALGCEVAKVPARFRREVERA